MIRVKSSLIKELKCSAALLKTPSKHFSFSYLEVDSTWHTSCCPPPGSTFAVQTFWQSHKFSRLHLLWDLPGFTWWGSICSHLHVYICLYADVRLLTFPAARCLTSSQSSSLKIILLLCLSMKWFFTAGIMLNASWAAPVSDSHPTLNIQRFWVCQTCMVFCSLCASHAAAHWLLIGMQHRSLNSLLSCQVGSDVGFQLPPRTHSMLSLGGWETVRRVGLVPEDFHFQTTEPSVVRPLPQLPTYRGSLCPVFCWTFSTPQMKVLLHVDAIIAYKSTIAINWLDIHQEKIKQKSDVSSSCHHLCKNISRGTISYLLVMFSACVHLTHFIWPQAKNTSCASV